MPAELPEVLLKLLLAVLLAGVLGAERERKGRAAGLRTHVLVCLGSTLAMLTAEMSAQRLGYDPGRIAAGIITGIGFLGAGAFINIGSERHGLTTAAMLWFVAMLGIAIGMGHYAVGVCATVFALIAVVALEYLERFLPAAQHFTLTLRMPGDLAQTEEVEAVLRDHGFRVRASRLRKVAAGEGVDMTFDIDSKQRANLERLAQELEARFQSAQLITFER